MIHRLLSLSLFATLAALGGCAADTASTPDLALAPVSDVDFVSPVVRGAENGLEMHWWVVEGSPEALRAAVSPFAGEDCGADDATRRSLAGAGLRLVRVPLAELTTIREGLKLRGRTDRKWLGQAPWWVEALRGALTGEGVAMQRGRLITLPSGRLRVITRAWTAPGTLGPVMRADVAVQHLPRLAELIPNLQPGDAARSLEPQKQGPVFDETLASLEMQRGYAYLLICDDPDAAWPGEEVEINPMEATYLALREGAAGPPTVSPPSLGERLLRRAATPLSGEESMTAVVVLAPRLPERFALLP